MRSAPDLAEVTAAGLEVAVAAADGVMLDAADLAEVRRGDCCWP